MKCRCTARNHLLEYGYDTNVREDSMTSQHLLTLAIEAKRSELYHQADRSSFTSPHVLKLSHELDLLLLEYTRFVQKYTYPSSNESVLG